jgi:hypothetical protein
MVSMVEGGSEVRVVNLEKGGHSHTYSNCSVQARGS